MTNKVNLGFECTAIQKDVFEQIGRSLRGLRSNFLKAYKAMDRFSYDGVPNFPSKYYHRVREEKGQFYERDAEFYINTVVADNRKPRQDYNSMVSLIIGEERGHKVLDMRFGQIRSDGTSPENQEKVERVLRGFHSVSPGDTRSLTRIIIEESKTPILQLGIGVRDHFGIESTLSGETQTIRGMASTLFIDIMGSGYENNESKVQIYRIPKVPWVGP